MVRWKTGEYVASLSSLLEASSSVRILYGRLLSCRGRSCGGGDNRKAYGVN